MHTHLDDIIAQKFHRQLKDMPQAVMELMRRSITGSTEQAETMGILSATVIPQKFEELIANFCVGYLYVSDHYPPSPKRIEIVDELLNKDGSVNSNGMEHDRNHEVIRIARTYIGRAIHNQKGNNCGTTVHLPVTFKIGDLWKCLGIEYSCAATQEDAGVIIRQGAKDLLLVPYNPWEPAGLFINKNQKTGFDTRGTDIVYFQGVLDRENAGLKISDASGTRQE